MVVVNDWIESRYGTLDKNVRMSLGGISYGGVYTIAYSDHRVLSISKLEIGTLDGPLSFWPSPCTPQHMITEGRPKQKAERSEGGVVDVLWWLISSGDIGSN